MNSYGVARENEIRKHIQIGNKEIIAEAIKNLLESGEVTIIKISGIDDQFYALSDRLNKLTNLRKLKSRVLIISPFDNLIIQRERLKRLFGFDYALECYTPAAKRKYGYFVLPILFGEQFMGRVDPKADRKRKTLVINNIYFESKPNNIDQYLISLARCLWQMARFNNCEKIEIKKSTPAKFKKELQRQLKNHTP